MWSYATSFRYTVVLFEVKITIIFIEMYYCNKYIYSVASRFGHLNVVVWLVENKQCSALEQAQNGVTPVHLAAAKGSINCLKWLSQTFPG